MLCQGEELRPWVEEAIGQELPSPATFIGDLLDGQPHAVAAFCEWRQHSVEIHVACGGSFTRAFLRRLARYAFDELGVRYVRGYVAADKADWLKTLSRLGFVREGVQRGGVDGAEDLVMLSIQREEFRI